MEVVKVKEQKPKAQKKKLEYSYRPKSSFLILSTLLCLGLGILSIIQALKTQQLVYWVSAGIFALFFSLVLILLYYYFKKPSIVLTNSHLIIPSVGLFSSRKIPLNRIEKIRETVIFHYRYLNITYKREEDKIARGEIHKNYLPDNNRYEELKDMLFQRSGKVKPTKNTFI